MTDPFEVIGAFADGERIDGEALKQALSTPEGRDYLVDLLALRQVVRKTEPSVVARRRIRPLRWAAAAALLLARGGAWFYASGSSGRPPAPDRVVKLERGLDWSGN